MDLPFYLRILPSEALEVLAYYRRRGSNLAYADAMLAATGLSERGFGKAIRRLVTKGYLVLDGDQRYRLTEHGQRAVDDLPGSMAERDSYDDADASEMVDEPEVERVPLDSSDNFDALFGSAPDSDDIDSLFDEPVEVDIDVERFLAEDDAQDDALASLFAGTGADVEEDEQAEDDLFDELDDEESAAFETFFGGAEDEDESTPEVVVGEAVADLVEIASEAPADEREATDEDSAGEDSVVAAVSPAVEAALDDLFADFDDDLFDVEDAEFAEQLADLTVDAGSEPADDGLAFLEPAPQDEPESVAESPVASGDSEALNESSLEWLALDDSQTDDFGDLWGTADDAAAPAAESAQEAADTSLEASDTASGSRIIERRLVVALPQPLVAGQPAHVTIGILPDAQAPVEQPLSLVVRLDVVNGEPPRVTDLPMLLTNGLARQDVTVTPGRYDRLRLRLNVYQVTDEADEAIACGGMYVDADVVAEARTPSTPVAYGIDTHFFVDA